VGFPVLTAIVQPLVFLIVPENVTARITGVKQVLVKYVIKVAATLKLPRVKLLITIAPVGQPEIALTALLILRQKNAHKRSV
jgi:hypothetical protein